MVVWNHILSLLKPRCLGIRLILTQKDLARDTLSMTLIKIPACIDFEVRDNRWNLTAPSVALTRKII